MIYKKLGSSGLEVSAIGFGCWQLGGELNIGGVPQGFGKIDENEAREAIHHALDRGVNFFDTADFYGLGRSESILGEELKDIRKNVIICTKGGCIPDGVQGTAVDGSYEHLIAACNRSLKRLRTDYLDLYLLHFIPSREEEDESIRALQRLKESGEIREYGLSVAHKLEMIPEVINKFPVIEGYYNALLRDFEDFAPLISRKRAGFIAASPLSRGLLSGRDFDKVSFSEGDVRKKWEEGGAQHNWYNQQKEELSRLKRLSREWGIPLKYLSLAYIISNGISTAIPGMRSRQQVAELVESLKYLPLAEEKVGIIRKEKVAAE